MALLDLSSDLSRFRSETSKEAKNTPEASKATNNKNFATMQPITQKLSSFSPTINKVETKKLEDNLGSTRLDDIRKFAMENLLINSVSRFSDVNLAFKEESLGQISTEQVASRYNKLQQGGFVSRLDKSNTLVVKTTQGTNNLTSPIDIVVNKNDASDNIQNPNINITPSQLTFDRANTTPNIKPVVGDATDNITNPNIDIIPGQLTFDRSNSSPNISVNKNDASDNITNPDVVINNVPLTFDRTKSSPNLVIKQDDATDNITNPNVDIVKKALSFDRTKQSVNINTDLVSPINNIVDPKIALETTTLVFDRKNETPNIITDTIKEGLVTDPNTKTFKVENGKFHLTDESRLNPDGMPIKFVVSSKLVNKRPQQDVDVKVYNQQSQQLKDNSRLNVDKVEKTIPSGRNEDPNKSKFAIIGTQSVNFFPDTNGSGFTTKPQKGVSLYTDSSEYSWKGSRNDAPSTNFITDVNGVGFNTFVKNNETLYKNETSIYGFTKIPETNFFDINQNYTSEGFKSFVSQLKSVFQKDSSSYTFKGSPQNAPETNFFDVSGNNTSNGFEKFTQQLVSRYIKDSSRFDFDGSNQNAPETNFFDVNGTYTTKGFEKFAQKLQSKYVRDVSAFGFAGSKQSAPTTDFFDNSKASGFTKFPQKMQSEYSRDSSEFTFKGTTPKAVNFFDNTSADGFTNKIGKLESKYKKDISGFTFKGTLPKPVDFFQNTNAVGFENKIQQNVTKYKKDSSNFTFKGTTPKSVDFFDNSNATGFTNKIAKNETKYIPDSSEFTFKGSSQNALTVNYIPDTFNAGFTKFPKSLESEYITDVSRYGFKGTRATAPNADFLTNTNGKGFTNLVQALETDYDVKSSKFTWVGNRQQAPAVDFFKIPGNNPNGISGFDTLFDDKTKTKYSDSLSSLSIESSNNKSTVRNVPFTTFFGYRPAERSGFMVNMSTFDGTLYPIIEPKLKYSDSQGTRFSVASSRSVSGGLSSVDLETYAPLSLGKRPWANGTLFSTLDTQVPNIKTKGIAGSYSNKYERGVKDNTERQGYLTKWATTRNSPSPLDEQYLKYKLQNESVNREVAAFNQPYVVRGIQRHGEVENQRWGFGVTFDDGIVRGGAVTQAERILQDVFRIGKFTASVKGGLFVVKQLGLQAMNPAVDVDPKTPTSGLFGVSATLGYNPLTMLANVATARGGVHLARHGLFPFDSDYLNKYGKATSNRELNQRFIDPAYKSFENLGTPNEALRDPGGYSRLIGLMKELLPNSFKPTNKEKSPSMAQQLKELVGISSIARISSTFGGAQSYFGIGGTSIRRAGHPYLTNYTTSPTLEKSVSGGTAEDILNAVSQTQPQYLDSAKRDTYYAATKVYGQQDVGNIGEKDLKQLTYTLGGAKISGEESNNGDRNKIGFQSEIIDAIEKYNPFSPKYPVPADKFKKKTGNTFKETLNDGPNPYDVDSSNLIKQYRTVSYGKLQKAKKGVAGRSNTFNDFRHDLTLSGSESFITNPSVARYDSRNLEDYFGLGKQGKIGAQRNLPFVTNIEYRAGSTQPIVKSNQEFRGDRINIIDYKRHDKPLSKDLVYERGIYNNPTLPGAEDFVEFYFSSITLNGGKNNPAEAIVFRATFDSITDNHKPSWSSVKYMGRADPLYVYQGYERSISFGFTVHIGSRDEMKASWRKLNYLASWTAPEYTKAGFIKGPMIRLNIGNLYRKMPGYLANLTYTFDNTQTNWETAKLVEDQKLSGQNSSLSMPGVLQLPKTIQVSCEFVPVGVYRPEYGGTMYSLFDDTTGGGMENGLMPTEKGKVNYFKTFDNDTLDSNDNTAYLPIPPGKETEIPTQTGDVDKLFDVSGSSV